MQVRRVLRFLAELKGIDTKTANKRIDQWLERLSLKDSEKDWGNAKIDELSRGMQQKVAVSRALLTSPVLLLLDEPTTGLDPRSKKDVQRMVLSLRDEHDATVVLTTHDMEEADRMCDRVAVLDRGRIIALDTPDHLKQAGGSMEDVFMRLTHEEEEAA